MNPQLKFYSDIIQKARNYLIKEQQSSPIPPINSAQSLILRDIPPNTTYIEDENKRKKQRRLNIANTAPCVKGYETDVLNTDNFVSGRVIEDSLVLIPATKREEAILKRAGFNIIEEGKTVIIKDKDTGNVRGAINIKYDDEIEDEDDDIDFDELFSDDEEDDDEIFDDDEEYDDEDEYYDSDEDEDEEDEEDEYEEDEDNDKPKSVLIKYFDVDPAGNNVQKALTYISKSPDGYYMRSQSIKIARENVNIPFIRTFLL